MIAWLEVFSPFYLGLLAVGLVLSFTTRRQPLRHSFRIATAVLLVPIVCAMCFWAFVSFIVFKEPPTLADLHRDFPSKRADLERILQMSNEDLTFSRIDPTFLRRTSENLNQSAQYGKDDPNSGLPRPRWDAYRKIYARNSIRLGITRDASHDVFIMVDSVGLLNRGHASGYLHCAPTTPSIFGRFYPCMLHRDSGTRKYDPETRDKGYSFQKLDDRWYAYDEGPG